MSAELKAVEAKDVKGEVLTFDNDKDYVAIKLKEDGKTYVYKWRRSSCC